MAEPLPLEDDARVRCDVEGPVATVTLVRPDRRNAQTPVTWAALRRIGTELPDDVRVVVVRGEGASFSAGLDKAILEPGGLPGVPSLLDLAHASLDDADRAAASFQGAFAWLGRPGIISVAAVHGHAVGAGFQLALACDLRIAADDATFIMPETSLGLVPDLGGTRSLPRLVGYARALEICVTGRRVAADEAQRIGFVSSVVRQQELDQAVTELVDRVLAAPRDAVTETKALLLDEARREPEEQLAAERHAQWRRLRAIAGVDESAPRS